MGMYEIVQKGSLWCDKDETRIMHALRDGQLCIP